MTHLRPADYRVQPWANGRGQTIELLRIEQQGQLTLRLSMATVAEDGPFSIFPGIDRNLTVIAGPGFVLRGLDAPLTCALLWPVAFPGDVAVQATGTANVASQDFNVMTARHLPRPVVTVHHRAAVLPAGATHYLFALGDATVDAAKVSRAALSRHDLLIVEGAAQIWPGAPVLSVSQRFPSPARTA